MFGRTQVRKRRRLWLSVDAATARYLTDRARRETRGDVSALVERLARGAQLAEALGADARRYAEHPEYAEAVEIDRYAE